MSGQSSLLHSQSLSRPERLRNAASIQAVFETGKYFSVGCILCKYLIFPAIDGIPAQAAFIVPKRYSKKAVRRNLIRRRMKESYRKQKGLLYSACLTQSVHIQLLLLFRSQKEALYPEIFSVTEKILMRLQKEIIGNHPAQKPEPTEIDENNKS